ncbi:fatty acyl-CoA reductase 1-like [Chrysoperla carnea]|uniref:fatty acyl-CoA reductase 1-like n=1 Tax=Chrysoperla carnea TaxID=189513 RepID=UPI001D09628E|nr:fatty acyl-CoA reductase 1-like [Chrysoperla carnea]
MVDMASPSQSLSSTSEILQNIVDMSASPSQSLTSTPEIIPNIEIQKILRNENDETSLISKWYAGRSVLVTGATGFVGKVLIEKLLRSCPNINKIYVLIRFKKGKKPEDRLADMIQLPLFSEIKKSNLKAFQKLHVINGDLSLPNLNLSDEDKTEIINNVSIIFHCGANLNIHEQIKLSITTNAIGTKDLLRLSNYIQQLDAFVFLSTIFAHDQKSAIIDEKPAAQSKPAVKIAESILSFREDSVDKFLTEFLSSDSNVYHYSKRLAEQIIIQETNIFPTCIVRCSIVTASLTEPFPGWIDNEHGPTNIIIGTGKGTIRSYRGYYSYTADLVPVDILVNCLITAGYNIGKEKCKNVSIFNCTSGNLNRLTWGQFSVYVPNSARKCPFENITWFPRSNLRQSTLLHNFHVRVLHAIPAYVYDLIGVVFGKERSYVKTYSKYREAVNDFEYYTTHQWNVDNTNLLTLQSTLSQRDKWTFNFNILSITWPEYFDNYVKGVRKYVLKKDDATIPDSKSRLRRMFLLHQCYQLTFVAVFTYLFTHPVVKKVLRQTVSSAIVWYSKYNVDLPISQLITNVNYDQQQKPAFSLKIITLDLPIND